ncbi:MAG: S41 family peptidase [Bacteroidota bacterium]
MKKTIIGLLILLLPLLSFYSCQPTINKQRKLENISAFTKLYGYVRWFHPSDEAQEIDWKKFAVYGVQKIENTPDDEALKDSLLKLFRPIAPTLNIMLKGKKTPQPVKYEPSNSKKFKETYWQHLGVDLGRKSNVYKSRRIYRAKPNQKQQVEISYVAEMPENWVDKKIRLSFDAKSTGKIKVFLRRKSSDFLKKIVTNPSVVQGEIFECNKWKTCQIEWTPNKSDNGIIFGLMRVDSNTLYIDNIKIEYREKGQWKTHPIENSNFKVKPKLGREGPIGVPGKLHVRKNAEWVQKNNVNNQEYCLKLPYRQKLFPETPKDKPILQKAINSSLHIQLPVMLYANEDHTYPNGDTSELLKLKQAIDEVEYAFPYNWLGSYTITWNVFQHFFPYHEEIDVQWKNELNPGIMSLYNAQSNQHALKEFKRLMSKTKDGHLTIKSLYDERNYFLPIRWQWIEDQLVIISSHSQVDIPKGSIVNKIAGQPAKAYFNKISPLVTAPTTGFHNYKMEMYTLKGTYNDSIGLTIITPQENTQSFYLHFNRKTPLFRNPNDSLPSFRSIKNGIFYCNLDRLENDPYLMQSGQIKNSKAIIFDLRGYPASAGLPILEQLIKIKDTIKPYYVPLVIFPDRENLDYKKAGWNLEPAKKRLTQPVVFLTNSMAISAAESIMLWVKHYGLGTIIGQPTAGTNGNVNIIELPIGKLMFTGLKVEFPDGTQHFARGVLPDIEIKQTVEAFREGRDLHLEKAAELLSNSIETE